MIADVGAQHDMVGPLALLPVPNSRCAVGCAEPPRTCVLADALATELNRLIGSDAVVIDVLRWSEALQAAHAGGSREPQFLFDRLSIADDLSRLRGRRAILV